MSRPTLAALGLTAVLCLPACASGGDEREPDPAASRTAESQAAESQDAEGNEAALSVDGREFTVTLTMCTAQEGGDILLSGPAQENGTDVTGHFDGDASDAGGELDGEFRVDIGATGPYQSTDEFVAFGTSIGGTLTLSKESDRYVLTGSAWNAQGQSLGDGVLTFRCD
ncbi:MAG TPA: hypothetical protein VNZ66_02030 [Aeromicrobium sp.]|nr:hypothetical protein [Aeromicrobium sp.]